MKTVLFALLATALGSAALPTATAGSIVDFTFEDQRLGAFNPTGLGPNVFGRSNMQNGTIVEDPDQPGNRVLKVKHPQGVVPPETGAGFYFDVMLEPEDRYWFSYLVRFDDDFVWRAGGKVPGLAGGDAASGGKPVDGDGWSARQMWFDTGRFAPYVYHMDQAGMYGDTFGGTSSLGPRSKFIAGQWHHVAGYVELNTDNNNDGRYMLYLDGVQLKDRTELRYRNEGRADIDRALFVTFFGGQSDDYRPIKDEYNFFDDFRVSQDVDFVFATYAGGTPDSAYINGPPGLAGDFNADSAVDGKDFLVWQRGGSPSPMSPADLADWNDNFGNFAFAATSRAAATAVPEPTALGLVLSALLLMPRRRRNPYRNSRPNFNTMPLRRNGRAACILRKPELEIQ